MKNQIGFTLIELVIVIILLGILAVTAAPKFLNMQDDARTSTLKGMEGALKAASAMVYSKAVLAGKEKPFSATGISLPLGNGKSVKISYGYPIANPDELLQIAEIPADWVFGQGYGSQNVPSVRIYPKGMEDKVIFASKTPPTKCFVEYTEAVDEHTPPLITSKACQ